jgi:hypothetical protein
MRLIMSKQDKRADYIAGILAELESEELDALADLDRTELAVLIEQARRKQADARRLLSGQKSIKFRETKTLAYAANEEKPGKPARILVRGAGPQVEVHQDGEWHVVPHMLPEGFPGKGEGVWQNYSLQPTSADYAPINWFRYNYLLQRCGAVYGPEMTPEEFARLPEKALRSASRKPIVLAYLLGGQNPGQAED